MIDIFRHETVAEWFDRRMRYLALALILIPGSMLIGQIFRDEPAHDPSGENLPSVAQIEGVYHSYCCGQIIFSNGLLNADGYLTDYKLARVAGELVARPVDTVYLLNGRKLMVGAKGPKVELRFGKGLPPQSVTVTDPFTHQSYRFMRQ